MSKIIFLNDTTTVYDAKLINYSQNVIRIVFNNSIPTDANVSSGFYVANENNFSNMTGDKYFSFTTIWKKANKEVDLSNDGTTYIPHVATLNEVKNEKISKFSSLCEENILNGINVTLSNGTTEHFSYSIEDQTNIKELFDMCIQTNVPQYYHADSQLCREYLPQDIILIYSRLTLNKLSTITYFNQIKAYILTLEDIDTVKNIQWGEPLTGEYLNIYNQALSQAVEGFNALLGITNEDNN